MATILPVSFVLLQEERPIAQMERLDPDRDWREFVTTTSAWILQTFLRLKAAGDPVVLRDDLPNRGIAVLSAGDHRVVKRATGTTTALIATAQGSFRRRPGLADAVIVQNPVEADGHRRCFVPHWPQPGLVPRNSLRGTRVERAAFKGFPNNLDPSFRESGWSDFLRQLGIVWLEDAVAYEGARTDAARLQFPDYSSVDLIVAVRPPSEHLYPDRPATKLVNAWLAGVPAILGPESAYRAIRRGPLDYIEVRDIREARDAVERLVQEPDLYQAMVDNGRARAAEFDLGAVRSAWRELLYERLPTLAREPAVRFMTNQPLWVRRAAGRWRWRR